MPLLCLGGFYNHFITDSIFQYRWIMKKQWDIVCSTVFFYKFQAFFRTTACTCRNLLLKTCLHIAFVSAQDKIFSCRMTEDDRRAKTVTADFLNSNIFTQGECFVESMYRGIGWNIRLRIRVFILLYMNLCVRVIANCFYVVVMRDSPYFNTVIFMISFLRIKSNMIVRKSDISVKYFYKKQQICFSLRKYCR